MAATTRKQKFAERPPRCAHMVWLLLVFSVFQVLG